MCVCVLGGRGGVRLDGSLHVNAPRIADLREMSMFSKSCGGMRLGCVKCLGLDLVSLRVMAKHPMSSTPPILP